MVAIARSACTFVLFLFVALAATPTRAAVADSIVVKFRGDEALAAVPVLPPSHRAFLADTLQTGIEEAGRTKDGAFRIVLRPALPFAAAQAALNRLRWDPRILYAGLAASLDERHRAASNSSTGPSIRSRCTG